MIQNMIFIASVAIVLIILWKNDSYGYERRKRWLPTDFRGVYNADGLALDDWPSHLRPTRPLRRYANDSKDIGQYVFIEQLAGGLEGSTSIYHDRYKNEDVVIKTFSTKHHPLRNVLPRSLESLFGESVSHWPTEIPASLLFGGISSASFWSDTSTLNFRLEYLPVYDYFIMSHSALDCSIRHIAIKKCHQQWHLVTPYLPDGTVNHLGQRIHASSSSRSIAALDDMYRPAFTGVQRMIRRLHDTGFCHDDVKAANIFVHGSTRWLLSDLGAMREITHSWHGSYLLAFMGQRADCRDNDMARALKVYLAFLRGASENLNSSTQTFDEAFWQGVEPWSRLYWNGIASLGIGRASRQVLDIGDFLQSGRPPSGWCLARLFWSTNRIRAFAVSRELHAKKLDSFDSGGSEIVFY